MKLASRRRFWTVPPFMNSMPQLNNKLMNSIYPGSSFERFLFSFKRRWRFQKKTCSPLPQICPGKLCSQISPRFRAIRKVTDFLGVSYQFPGHHSSMHETNTHWLCNFSGWTAWTLYWNVYRLWRDSNQKGVFYTTYSFTVRDDVLPGQCAGW